MKVQEVKELKNKSLAELETMRKEGREELRGLKLDLAAGKVKNVGALRNLKKDIARVETFITMQRAEGKTK